jgi:hypothetical protein
VGTAGGQAAFTFPDDGEVSLLITDYREYYYLPASPIGFWALPIQHNVLGLTGFLQYFSMQWFNDGQTIPEVELTENPTFPGQHGRFAVQPIGGFLRRLKGLP